MPHLPKAESAAFTGPENPHRAGERGDRAEEGHRDSSADPDLAGLVRSGTAGLRRRRARPETERPTAIMRPADARLLLSVGAPSPSWTRPPSRVRGAAGLRGDTGPGRAGPRRSARSVASGAVTDLACHSAGAVTGRCSPLSVGSRPADPGVFREVRQRSSCHLRQDHPSLKSGSR